MNIIKQNFIYRIVNCFLLFLILFVFTAFPLSAINAQTPARPVGPTPEYTLLEPLPCISNSTTNPDGSINKGTGCTEDYPETINFENYVQYIFNLAIALAAVAAVFTIVWGGFKYTSTDSFTGKSEGKEIIFKALQGLILVLASFLILQTIDPRLVNIRKDLVKPLAIPCQVNGVIQKDAKGQTIQATSLDCDNSFNKYFTDLKTQAEKYSDQVNGLKESINKADIKVKDYEDEKFALEKKLIDKGYYSYDDLEAQAIQTRIAQLNILIPQEKTNSAMDTYVASMAVKLNEMTKNGQLNNKAYLETVEHDIGLTFKRGKEALIQAGNLAGKEQILEDQENLALATIAFQKKIVEYQESNNSSEFRAQVAAASVGMIGAGVTAVAGVTTLGTGFIVGAAGTSVAVAGTYNYVKTQAQKEAFAKLETDFKLISSDYSVKIKDNNTDKILFKQMKETLDLLRK